MIIFASCHLVIRSLKRAFSKVGIVVDPTRREKQYACISSPFSSSHLLRNTDNIDVVGSGIYTPRHVLSKLLGDASPLGHMSRTRVSVPVVGHHLLLPFPLFTHRHTVFDGILDSPVHSIFFATTVNV